MNSLLRLLALAVTLMAAAAGSNAHNFDRLTQIGYPTRPDAVTRHIALEYGDNAGGPDSILSRITKIRDTGVIGELGRYDYAGAGRRVRTRFGCTDAGGATFDAEQSFAGTSGYEGLDRFGRPKDLHYTRGGTGHTLWRAQAGYDPSGNRLFERIERASTISGGVESNARSWLFGYDALDRLVAADTGALDGSNAAVGASSALPVPQRWGWAMDLLGNWAGDDAAQPALAGLTRRGDFDADSVEDVLEVTHQTDARNRLGTLLEDDGSGGSPVSTDLVHDRAGNLVCDGTYLYQYDGLNRLVAVRQKGSVTFDQEGEVDGGTAGAVVVVYAYDALGRLVRRHSPYPGVPGQWRSEHFYYDGARRIQEVLTDPIPNHSPVKAEEENLLNPVTWADREHVWGPGSVDEHLAQIDGWGILGSSLLDPSGTPVMVLDDQGRPSEAAVFDPYGSVLDHRTYAGTQQLHGNRLGRQGLFFERLDADVLAPQLHPGAEGLYQARNRTYLPGLGRWGQMDPNGAGQSLALGLLSHGAGPSLSVGLFNVRAMYGDRMSLYRYCRSDPVGRRDPAGLTALGVGLFGGIALGNELRARDAASSGAAGNVLLNSGFWEQVGLTMIGGAALFGDELADLLGFLAESESAAPNDYATPEDAIGWEAINGIELIKDVPTGNPEIRAKGYTRTRTYEDSYGKRHTVHHNPRTNRYTPAHDSGVR